MRSYAGNRLCLAAFVGYLLGSLPTADIAARVKAATAGSSRTDLRRKGTMNPGALNAAKVLGARWGLAVLATDIAKGVVAALAGRKIAGANGAYAAGTTAVIGHCAPVWTGFRGGKGVATQGQSVLAQRQFAVDLTHLSLLHIDSVTHITRMTVSLNLAKGSRNYNSAYGV